jgi:hypothetical protein
MGPTLVVMMMVLLGGAVSAQADGATAGEDQTVGNALQLLRLPRAERPRVQLVAPGQFRDPDKDLESFAAFRLRHGASVDPVIYLNPRHRFYLEAKACGPDLYPLVRLASVILHEWQHGQADHAEATALRAQAVFLRRQLVLLAHRRDDALAYVQALEASLPAARQWDATGHFPAVEVR